MSYWNFVMGKFYQVSACGYQYYYLQEPIILALLGAICNLL
jgi:hypothetical protein